MEHSFVEVDDIIITADEDYHAAIDKKLPESNQELKDLADSPITTDESGELSTEDHYEATLENRMKQTKQIFESMSEKLGTAYEFFQKDFKLIESRRETLKEMEKKLCDNNFGDIVRLNVGGEIFDTNMQTLQKYPDSFFSVMFSGRTSLEKTSDGSYFIDRDGKLFR